MATKIAVAVVAAIAMTVGAVALMSPPWGDPGPPCYDDPNVQCLFYVDPVRCVKPGEGWKTYTNACFAMKDCARSHTCVPTGM